MDCGGTPARSSSTARSGACVTAAAGPRRADEPTCCACCRAAPCRKTGWRCFIAAVCATFTLSQMSRDAQHGMIAFTGVHQYENKDWLMQMPFILVNAGASLCV